MKLAQEIEIEFKNLLTKEEFNCILYSLPFPSEPKNQKNHYFETADFSLKKSGCALRVREKNDTYTLTLKEPHTTGLLETHDTLTRQEAHEWMKGNSIAKEHTSKQLAKREILTEDLIYFGSLTTERRELKYGAVLLVLDYSIYGDTSDYELELEATSEAIGRETMEEILEKFTIKNRHTPNKIQRFFASKANSDSF